MAFLARIAEIDNRALRDAVVAAAEADYQAAALEDLKAQDVTLRALLRQREADLVRARDEQNALVAKLTAQERERLRAYRAKRAKTRQAWRESSIPAGRPVPTAQAVVEPYADRTYLVAAYQPRRYRTTGETYTAVCSWYGNEFDGRPTASGQIFNQNDLTCASRGLAFGTRLALTRGGRGVIVVVNDRGPFIAGRDLDLSRAAARALGFSGVERVHVEVVTALE
ncbi:MAG: septal ring lytic transglycosylase RlpA family protein [Coriobacteriia bacterium]|nr:septal ring lytic transglycosylase RlpA family protein [Coriobacteriia bacterium]